MIKRFCALLAACFWLLLTTTSWADMIWSPSNDGFFNEHYEDCVDMVRYFYANGENGYISLKESPISDKVVARFKNGEKIYIGFTYNYNGEPWGVASIGTEDNYGSSGWIPMKELVLVYDYISFDEEHKDEYYKYKGNYETLKNAKEEIVLWSWPGSGDILSTMDKSEIDKYIDYMSERSKDDDDFYYSHGYSHAYKDKQGREWLYTCRWDIVYRDFWICLNDPCNAEIPAFNPAPQPKLIPPKELPAVNAENSNNELVIPVSLVGGLVFVTSIMLKLF